MNCLNCSNYWKTDIDEKECDKCGGDLTIADIWPSMPPLILSQKTQAPE